MIFLVDDDDDDLDLFQEVLHNAGYSGKCEKAHNGQELMDQLNSIPATNVQLIVLDLNMPVKNGFEALKEIKSSNTLRSIPVVILSASSSDKDREVCIALGCSLFVRKPNSMKEYGELIDRLLKLLDHNKQ